MIYFRTTLFSVVFLLVGCNAIAANLKPEISLDVVGVERYVINKSLIRVIQFNTEEQPKFIVERLSRPSVRVLEKLVITKLDFNGRVLDFNDTAGVFIEKVMKDKQGINFDVYFVYPGKGGGSVDLRCYIKVGKEKFHPPICSEKNK